MECIRINCEGCIGDQGPDGDLGFTEDWESPGDPCVAADGGPGYGLPCPGSLIQPALRMGELENQQAGVQVVLHEWGKCRRVD